MYRVVRFSLLIEPKEESDRIGYGMFGQYKGCKALVRHFILLSKISDISKSSRIY